jgi:hypothetical protein
MKRFPLRTPSNRTILREQGRMVEMKITIDDAGRVNVNGPIANNLLCYGMLEMAKDAIASFNAKPASSIIPVDSAPLVLKDHQ